MELKIREISKELNTVLQRLNKENEKILFQDETKNEQSFEKIIKSSKAYVTILREVK